MTIDKISQYCLYNDYPIYRYHFHKYRDQINKLILYPSKQHGLIDFEDFSRKVFIGATWVEPVKIQYGVEDWRQAETMPCLGQSNADWVWFSEQDFFVTDWDKFFRDIKRAMSYSDAIGLWNETHFPYLHPSCLFIKREVLEKTHKDFSAHSEIPGCDHFAMITRDLIEMSATITKIQDIGYTEWENCFHLGGLTYVYQDWKGDGTDIFGVNNIEIFRTYNFCSARAPVEQSQEYIKLTDDIERELYKRFGYFDCSQSKYIPYFQ